MKYWNPILKTSKTESEIKAMFPNISFGEPFTPPSGWFKLVLVAAPSYNPITQDIMEADAIQAGQVWIQSWQVINVTPEEAQRRLDNYKLTVKNEMIAFIQDFLDAKAKEHSYDNIFTAVTYADEPSVLKFQVEGKAFRAWRSLVWAKAYEILADVEAGRRQIPTKQQLSEELPQFTL